MKAYIDGKLSNENQSLFLPARIWFMNPNDDFEYQVTNDCICIDGVEVESSVDKNEFTCRWRGVEMSYINDDGECIESEEFTVEEFIKLIQEKNMHLINMDAYYDFSVNVTVTKFKLTDGINEFILDSTLIDEIELVD